MTDLPEDEARESAPIPALGDLPAVDAASSAAGLAQPTADEPPDNEPPIDMMLGESTAGEPPPVDPPNAAPSVPDPSFVPYAEPGTPANAEPPLLFQSFAQPPVRPPARIPHFGHVSLLIPVFGIAFVCTILVLFFPMRLHFFGWSLSPQIAATNVSLILASEAILYLFVFAISLLVFPLFWHEKLLIGLQWRGAVAIKRFWPLAATALGCAGLAALDEVLLPGPKNAPIDRMFSAPGAAWLMFAFGTTLAPFFEEMFFRGFLLPAFSTAWDWAVEQVKHRAAPPLDANGHPQWSIPAMVVGSILTSIPFALLHVEQQGHSLGPFLLLIVVSLVLCTVRLKTRSLAASTLVHATYNFIIFSLALIGTGGFRHFDKM
ncbi:MAG: CPBP family glutamic-type intramembrane protease [Terracidiphilus sp.]|jgi:membrane protease YdiL (CAAX protease family)